MKTDDAASSKDAEERDREICKLLGIPYWKDHSKYPKDTEKTPDEEWRWEFLRRDPNYQDDWKKLCIGEFARELDTTSTRWKFWRTDDAASKPFMNTMAAIISNPVFYDGTMYLFAQPSSQETKLYALRLGGGNLWEPKALSIRPGSHAMVSPAGRLYSIGEDRVVLYDLKQAGAEIRNVPIANFKPALRPILGEDGSLYAMPPGALFGFNPDLQEMWRYPGAKTDMPDASRVVLSPDAGRYAYMLAKRGTATQLVRLETATGNATVSGLPIIDVTQAGKTSTENLDLPRPTLSGGCDVGVGDFHGELANGVARFGPSRGRANNVRERVILAAMADLGGRAVGASDDGAEFGAADRNAAHVERRTVEQLLHRWPVWIRIDDCYFDACSVGGNATAGEFPRDRFSPRCARLRPREARILFKRGLEFRGERNWRRLRPSRRGEREHSGAGEKKAHTHWRLPER